MKSLTIADLRQGHCVVVECAHRAVLGVVTVTKVSASTRSHLRLLGSVLLPDRATQEMQLDSSKLLGQPWGSSWRTMRQLRGKPTTPRQPRCGCDFFLPTPL